MKFHEEPEFMTLQDALLKRKGDQLLQWENETPVEVNGDKLICTKTRILFSVYNNHVTDKRWKIIPAEPKVLTADDLMEIAMEDERDISFNVHDLRNFIKIVDQNGRLERDIEWTEAINTTLNHEQKIQLEAHLSPLSKQE